MIVLMMFVWLCSGRMFGVVGCRVLFLVGWVIVSGVRMVNRDSIVLVKVVVRVFGFIVNMLFV